MPAVNVVASDNVEAARELFREYAKVIGDAEVCAQGFEREIEELPGNYAEPDGCLLVATRDGALAGCVALRPLGEGSCEMKRLYVRPAFRGCGIGKILVEALLEYAAGREYRKIQLDSLPSMVEAHALYRRTGFVEKRGIRTPDVLYFERSLPQPTSNPAMA